MFFRKETFPIITNGRQLMISIKFTNCSILNPCYKTKTNVQNFLQKTQQPTKKVPPGVHRDHEAPRVPLHPHLHRDHRPLLDPHAFIPRFTLSNKTLMIQTQMSTRAMTSIKMKREILTQTSVNERRKHELFSPALKYSNWSQHLI